MKNFLKLGVAGVSALAMVAGAQAGETNFSYTQFSIAAVKTTFDDSIYLWASPSSYVVYDEIGGVQLSGSYQLNNNIILGVSSAYQENSGHNTELNYTQVLFTAGYAMPVAAGVDLVFHGGLAYAEVEACQGVYGCFSEDDNGLYLAGGVRAWATPWLELNAGVAHVNYSDFDSATGIEVGAAGWLTSASSVFLSLGKDDDTRTVGLGYRYTF